MSPCCYSRPAVQKRGFGIQGKLRIFELNFPRFSIPHFEFPPDNTNRCREQAARSRSVAFADHLGAMVTTGTCTGTATP